MAHLGTLSLRERSTEDLLHRVAEPAKTVMPGTPEASVSLLVDGGKFTVVSTGELTQELDDYQSGLDEGPCAHSARTHASLPEFTAGEK